MDANQILQIGLQVWEFELFAVGGRSIAVRNLVIAFIFFVFGFILTRLLSRYFRKFLIRRLRLDPGPAATLESLAFYALLAISTLFALNISNIPLTVFTVVGGAIALGVGFGSQNVVRNFISGLILLMERPIQVGDVVEIEGVGGAVERIGTRSTVVRSYDNIDIVVPNSSFLEKNVVNWTLSDNIVRCVVTVGVSYGSPVERVRDVLFDAAAKHSEVLNTPSAKALFADFGDNALIFALYFWIRVDDIYKKKRVESDIRFSIDKMFRTEGIVIAFPQRDIHFDTKHPIPVSVVDHETV